MTTILFADDNRNINEHCRRELEDEGYRVLVAFNGDEALRIVDRCQPDVAVLDICMPGTNGLQALGQVRDRYPDLPVILFTSFDDACVHDERAWLATACVEKHEDLSELKSAISAALRHRHDARPYRLGLPPAGMHVSAGARRSSRSYAPPMERSP
ncbi:MAG: response regulator [Pirellulales bacterium]|nr:response regulator [Pirellulales bacterium]